MYCGSQINLIDSQTYRYTFKIGKYKHAVNFENSCIYDSINNNG